MIINGFGMCYMLNVCVWLWPVIIKYLVSVILNVCVCVASDH